MGHNFVGQEVSGAGSRGAELRGAGRHWGNIPVAERRGAGGQWGRTSWGRTSWGRTSLGHHPWGKRSVGQEVLGQEVGNHLTFLIPQSETLSQILSSTVRTERPPKFLDNTYQLNTLLSLGLVSVSKRDS